MINRRVDDLGRISLPIDMRRTLGIECGSEVAVDFKGNSIVITKPQEAEKKMALLARLDAIMATDQEDLQELIDEIKEAVERDF